MSLEQTHEEENQGTPESRSPWWKRILRTRGKGVITAAVQGTISTHEEQPSSTEKLQRFVARELYVPRIEEQGSEYHATVIEGQEGSISFSLIAPEVPGDMTLLEYTNAPGGIQDTYVVVKEPAVVRGEPKILQKCYRIRYRGAARPVIDAEHISNIVPNDGFGDYMSLHHRLVEQTDERLSRIIRLRRFGEERADIVGDLPMDPDIATTAARTNALLLARLHPQAA